MSTQEKCGNCGWFTPELSALGVVEIGLVDSVLQAVDPRSRGAMSGGSRPVVYGKCRAQFTSPEGLQEYGHGVFSISPCDAQDDQGLLLYSPK